MSDEKLPGEFSGGDLLDRLIEEFPGSYIEQTGGGTATFYFRKGEEDVPVLAGPGRYAWGNSRSSEFYTGDFSIGMEPYDNEGNERDHMGPDFHFDPYDIPAAKLLDVYAHLVRAAYIVYNSGQWEA